MGAGGSVERKEGELRQMSVAEVAKLAEGRPRVIADTILQEEIDGATLLELDEATVVTLASGLDQKKLLGGFRDLQKVLKPDIIVPEAQAPDRILEAEAVFIQEACQSAPILLEEIDTRRKVLLNEKYHAGWELLEATERKDLTALVTAVGTALKRIEDALASFLLDPRNQTKDSRYGQRPLLFQPEKKNEREFVLALLRKLQAAEAKELEVFVNAIVLKTYEQVPGVATSLIQIPSSISQQVIESCFENLDFMYVLSRDKWTEKVRLSLERAAALVSDPAFESMALHRIRVDPADPIWLAIRIDHRDGRTTALTWLYAEHVLVSEAFHATVATALRPLSQTCRIVPARLKSSQRSKAKSTVHGEYGGLRPKPTSRFLKDILRCSIVCQSHADLSTAIQLVLSHFAAAGPIKDRRHETPMHDILLHVFFSELVAEIQFHFAPVLHVKPFAHIPYEINRLASDNLTHLSALFDFPSIHLEDAKRTDISCKLAL